MGFNTSAMILNDMLSNIAEDKDLGKKIYDGVNGLCYDKKVRINCGGGIGAITLVETHHADHLIPIMVGCNDGFELPHYVHWQTKEEELEMALLERLADRLGYVLHKKPVKKTTKKL